MENNSEFEDLYSNYSTETDYYSSDFSIDENESVDALPTKTSKPKKTLAENSPVERTSHGSRIKWNRTMCEVSISKLCT